MPCIFCPQNSDPAALRGKSRLDWPMARAGYAFDLWTTGIWIVWVHLYAVFISLVNTTIIQHLKLVESELQTWRTRGYTESTVKYMQISNYPEDVPPNHTPPYSHRYWVVQGSIAIPLTLIAWDISAHPLSSCTFLSWAFIIMLSILFLFFF